MYTKEYNEIMNISRSLNEYNDCSVIALSIVTEIDYKTIRDFMFSSQLRNHKSPTSINNIGKTLDFFDYNYIIVRTYPKYKTVYSAEKNLDKNNSYLIFTKDHVLAMKNGKVHDWTSGRLFRTVLIYQIFPKE